MKHFVLKYYFISKKKKDKEEKWNTLDTEVPKCIPAHFKQYEVQAKKVKIISKYLNHSLSNGLFVNYSGAEPSVLHLYALILIVYNGENRHIRNY